LCCDNARAEKRREVQNRGSDWVPAATVWIVYRQGYSPRLVWRVLIRICNLSRLGAFEFHDFVRVRVSSD